MASNCGIEHRFGDSRCILPRGHTGPCWSKWERSGDGVIQRAEWWSRDGEYHAHRQYRARYPKNAARTRNQGESDGE